MFYKISEKQLHVLSVTEIQKKKLVPVSIMDIEPRSTTKTISEPFCFRARSCVSEPNKHNGHSIWTIQFKMFVRQSDL